MKIPDEVQYILNWWFPRVQGIFEAELASVYLYGSLTLDDFNSAWSDVDVCVVLENAATELEAAKLFAVHDEMRKEFLDEGAPRSGEWSSGQAVEAIYIPRELATQEDKGLCVKAYGGTHEHGLSTLGTAYDRYMLHHHGLLWWGEKIGFAAPDRREQVAQTREDLAGLREPGASRGSAIWLAGMMHWIARAIVFYRDGVMMSKSGALRHEIEQHSEFSEAYKLALALRQKGSARAGERHAELKRAFEMIALPATAIIEGLLATEK